MIGRCCVFQPFDKGTFDKRYDDVLVPAITDGGIEPYRVDRDDGAIIPIETLEGEIRSSVLCLADITTRNPSVMYEVGYAIASGKDVILICANNAPPYPFDVQHRGIIQYDTESPSDFGKLQTAITARIKALVRKQETAQQIVFAPLVKETGASTPRNCSARVYCR
jgi:hypothetical protein